MLLKFKDANEIYRAYKNLNRVLLNKFEFAVIKVLAKL